MIPAAMTLVSLPLLATIQMVTGIPLLNAIQHAAEEEDVVEQRFKLTIVGKGFSSEIHGSAENHIKALDNEIEYRKKYGHLSKDLPIYARISDAGVNLPPAKIRS
jgi:hypothetical protein